MIQHGVQHWLIPPPHAGLCAVQYVSDDRATSVLFLYQTRGVLGQGVRRARLKGLDGTRRYRRQSDGATSTGAALMAAGVPSTLVGDWRSEVQVWRAAG